MKADLNYTPGNVFETYPFPLTNNNLEELGMQYHAARKALLDYVQIGLTKAYNLFHNSFLKLIVEEDESIADKAFEEKHGKDGLWLKKHVQDLKSVTFNGVVHQIEELRVIHIKIDIAVLEAYGWRDINMQHGFYELEYLPENDRIRFSIHASARREILKRLLELNHQQHVQEENNLPKMASVRQKGTPVASSPTLF